MKIPYISFSAQLADSKRELLAATEKVLDGGIFILADEVGAFENEFAKYCGSRFAIGVSSGTAALYLAMNALGIGPGDEVITAPNSFIASASSIVQLGARPIFADVTDDMNIDPKAIEKAITPQTKAIMPVHLTGRPAQMEAILEIADKHHLYVIEDAAQAVGAQWKGKKVGSFGDVGCFSMHPLKNLHAYGDAGMITTDDPALNEMLRKARNHGLRSREECEFWSFNCRLDELQAAYLRINLRSLDRWTEVRRKIAVRYNEHLRPYATVPLEASGEYHAYQTYVIQVDRRDALLENLIAHGIDAKTHYRIPIHLQPAAKGLGYGAGDFPNTERIVDRIISLPSWPGMTEEQQDYVVRRVKEFYA